MNAAPSVTLNFQPSTLNHLEGVGGKPDLNLPDRIHPNPQGHKIVADNVWSVLEKMLTGEKQDQRSEVKSL